MTKIEIVKYNLWTQKEYKEFDKVRCEFLELLKLNYGEDRYWGHDIYNEKIDKRKLIIYLLYENKSLIGTIFLKPNGKFSGMAIDIEHRGKGYSTLLIRNTMKDYDHLFAEVGIYNQMIQKLLLNLGFKKLKDKDRIRELLKYEAILFINDNKADYIPYFHGDDKTKVDRSRKFMMMEYVK